MTYTHLTLELRKKIEFLYQLGRSQAYMARRLGLSRSTLSRELRRNASGKTYNALAAHKQAMQRKKRPKGILQENRPKGCGSVMRLRLTVSEKFLKKKRKKNYYAPADTSIRMARSKANYPFSGKSLHPKSLFTLEQKNNRRFYLKKRKRNHQLESQLRSPRLWWTVIRSVSFIKNKKHHYWYGQIHAPFKDTSNTRPKKRTTNNSAFKITCAAPTGRLRQAETSLIFKKAFCKTRLDDSLFKTPP